MAKGKNTVTLTVADNGPGLSEEALDHVTDRFYREEASRVRASGGSGLGLAISKTLTELHGGTLAVANRASGGAVFTVTLPKTSNA